MTDGHGDDSDAGERPARWPIYAVVVAVVAVVALLTAWAAGLQLSAPAPAGTDAVRLGPAAGEPVDGYLARVRTVPPGEGPRLALVQFAGGRDADAAAGAAAPGTEVLQAVYRLDLPRVQTAVRRLPLTVLGDGPDAGPAAIRYAQTQAANRARTEARTSTGRAAAIARVEADALGARCPCALALVVRGEPGALADVARRPGVRAVETAPASARPEALAVSPLLPEQGGGTTVGPVPDDGPVG